MLELRKEEESHNPADGSRTSPHVTAFAREIPSGRVEHLGGEVDHGDLRDVVGSTANTGAQRAESDGRCLGDDGVGDRSHAASEHEGDNDAETGLGVICRMVLWDGGAHAEKDEESEVDGCAPEVDGSAPEPRAKEPGEGVGHELQAGVD